MELETCSEDAGRRDSSKMTSYFSDWWLTEYAKDIEETLREKETRLVSYYLQSPQLEYRQYLVDLLCSIAESEGLSRQTVHLGVYLLDIFMDNHNIYPERLKLVTLVCLLLAAKFEERECKVPKIVDINNLIKNQYPYNDFFSLELMILTFMNWNLIIPTAAHYVEYYIGFLVLEDELEGNDYKDLIFRSSDLVFELLNTVLGDSMMMHSSPSKVAAACICTARVILNLEPCWPKQLEEFTKYSYADINKYVKFLIKSKMDDATRSGYKRKITDSGYMSDVQSTSIDDEVCSEESGFENRKKFAAEF